MSTSAEVLESLNIDLAKEHGAIIQYLIHSVQVRGSSAQMSIMENAREEMWHMEWLVEAIRDRGGTEALERAEVFTSESLIESMRADVDAEDGALAHYDRTLSLVGQSDPELSRLIGRIMDDERHHRATFEMLSDTIASAGEDGFRPNPGMSPADAAASAEPMAGLEYEGLLQYLWNKYGSDEKEDAEKYFELATNEMRHLYWVATCTGGLGVPSAMPVPADKIVRVESDADAHHRAEEYEREAAAVIDGVRKAVTGETIANELSRIGFQHGYHRFVLEHMESTAKV